MPVDTTPTLVGIGVGPGEASLITVKALDALSAADVILVPSTERSGEGAGRAEQIVCGNRPELASRIQRIPFSMADRSGVTERRKESWEASAEAAITAFEKGATRVAFATIGDPSVFSTFSYLAGTVRERLPEVNVEVIPGITAMQALAAASLTPLTEGTEVLALVPWTAGGETVKAVLEVADTVVTYKAGRQLPQLLTVLDEAGEQRRTVIGTDVGLEGEAILDADDVTPGAKLPYMSTVLSAPRRTITGGRL